MAMPCTRTVGASAILSKQSATQALKALNNSSLPTAAAIISLRPHQPPQRRHLSTNNRKYFSKSPNWLIREFFPETHTPHIRRTDPAWPHPIYTQEQMDAVSVAHRNAKTWSDYFALYAIKTMRGFFDIVSGYKHEKAVKVAEKEGLVAAEKKYGMNERKYMIRNIFLESVAGVPGMVAGMMRHLRSMRRMERDNGWMETLLEESYNERMHLLTFLQMAEPGWFMRLAVLGTQGIFFNAFFFCYILSPSTCHRAVGYLEEEAVITYTRQINDIDAGRLRMWEKLEAPPIAVEYWNMPEGKRTMRDLLLYIRADESKHREVNHTLGNLSYKDDPNPYVSKYVDDKMPHPTKDLGHQKPEGWERKDII